VIKMNNIKRTNEMKKQFIWVVILGLVFSFSIDHVSFAEKEGVFTDVGTEHWAYDEIYDMVEKGIITGHPDGTFRPNDPVQVDQFLKMILLALSEEQEDGSRDWADWFMEIVNGNTLHNITAGSPGFDFTNGEKNWAQPFIEQAQNMGIVQKYDRWGGTFNQPLNREGVAYLAFETVRKWQRAENMEYAKLTIPHIKDFNKIEHTHRAVMDVYIKGIMRGYDDGTFGVSKTVTRAEAVIVLYRIIDKSKRDPFYPDVSKLPYADVPTGAGYTQVVVFNTWEQKKMYDSVVQTINMTEGVGSLEETLAYFYKDQATWQKVRDQARDISTAFSYPLSDVVMGLDQSSYGYEIHISTVDGALERHEKAVLSFAKDALQSEEDAKLMLDEAKGYLKQLKENKALRVEKDFTHKKVLFLSGGSFPGTNESRIGIYIREKY
jgi:hypothetical protein